MERVEGDNHFFAGAKSGSVKQGFAGRALAGEVGGEVEVVHYSGRRCNDSEEAVLGCVMKGMTSFVGRWTGKGTSPAHAMDSMLCQSQVMGGEDGGLSRARGARGNFPGWGVRSDSA